MRPVFADPKTDFVFKRIFGHESHKHLLMALLNDLLELDAQHRIVDLAYLPAEQRVPVPELKLSVLDVKCTDATGTRYVVEMQVLNVEGFEKRVVDNVTKAYVTQLRRDSGRCSTCFWSCRSTPRARRPRRSWTSGRTFFARRTVWR